MKWRPFVYQGSEYHLSHLHPFEWEYTAPAGEKKMATSLRQGQSTRIRERRENSTSTATSCRNGYLRLSGPLGIGPVTTPTTATSSPSNGLTRRGTDETTRSISKASRASRMRVAEPVRAKRLPTRQRPQGISTEETKDPVPGGRLQRPTGKIDQTRKMKRPPEGALSELGLLVISRPAGDPANRAGQPPRRNGLVRTTVSIVRPAGEH